MVLVPDQSLAQGRGWPLLLQGSQDSDKDAIALWNTEGGACEREVRERESKTID